MARCTGQNTRRRTSGRSGIRQPWRQARAESRFMPLSCDSLQLVPNTPRRANSNRTRLNLLSQAMNVDLDRVCRDFFAPSEHYLRHAVLAHKSTSAADEDLQQREFTAGQLNLLSLDVDGPLSGVEPQWAVSNHVACAAHGAASPGPNASADLRNVHRHADAIIASTVKGSCAFCRVLRKRERQDRRLYGFGSEPANH